jgi:alpha/beta superfamily hydrolase
MSFFIPAKTVTLEAALREPRSRPRRAAAVVCHPHPAYGGTMENRVVFRTAKAATEAGLIALRFNFRGAGASTGSFDKGVGEKDDVRAALDWLENRYPGLPLSLAGFSFGAWVGLQVGCEDPRITALVGLGLPLSHYDFDFLFGNPKPALFIVGTHDEFCPADKLERLERRLPACSTLRRIENAGHFLERDLDSVQDLITGFLEQISFAEMTG